MTVNNEFEMLFAVPLECQSCVYSVSNALSSVKGVTKFDVDLQNNLVTTVGSVAPSQIVKTIQTTGKDAIIRGTGKPNSAAVCILESFNKDDIANPVKGLARIVSVAENDVVVDLTVNGLGAGTYYPSIRSSGNLSQGALSTGKLFYDLGLISVTEPLSQETVINSDGAHQEPIHDLYAGQSFLQAKLKVSDLIGRSIVLSRLQDSITDDSICGVIARSAGVWENDKQVCSCSGKTVWQERGDAKKRGVAV